MNAEHRIVGWTAAAPEVEHGRLRHPEAERLLGGPIFCTQVALLRLDEIVRAGGPAAWSGPWRCLALCRVEHARGFDQGRFGTLLPNLAAPVEDSKQPPTQHPRG